MTETLYADATAQHAASGNAASTAAAPSMFYMVSKRKATILYLCTWGSYSLYWFYKQWDHYKDNVPAASQFRTNVWPVQRALFSLFFIHSLFRKIHEYGTRHPEVAGWHHTAHAWAMVAMTLGSSILDRLAGSPMGTPLIDALSRLALVPLLLGLLRAQHMINLSCGDPAGDTNDKLTMANFVWVGIGVLLWASLILGWLLD